MSIKNSNENELLHAFIYGLKEKVRAEVLTSGETTVWGSLLYFSGKIYGETIDFLVDTGASNSFAPRELMQAL